MKRALPLVALLASTWVAFADDLPLSPAVTQETIATTICVPGWTKAVRPSARYTAAIKINLIRELEIPEELLVDVELDHRIPLALGGAPSEEQAECSRGTRRGEGPNRDVSLAGSLREQDRLG